LSQAIARSHEENGRFLKKAAQQLLCAWACGVATSTARMNKVFLLLFAHQKKPSAPLT
jgi:hypothetical protein